MARVTFFLALVLMFSFAPPGHAAPAGRPMAGNGFLVIPPAQENSAKGSLLSVYEEPGIRRLAEVDAAALPTVFPAREADGFALTVTGKKGEWVRIIYDDAGREGWVRVKKHWEYHRWSSYLKGGRVSLLPRLKDTDYMLRREASDKAPALETLSPGKPLQVEEVEGDWIKVKTGLASSGYLRWREGDGRITIRPEAASPGREGKGATCTRSPLRNKTIDLICLLCYSKWI